MDYKVVIDAGHGGSDSGSVANGVNEKDLNLQISQYMYERFRENDIPVTLIRQTDETISPEERVNRVLNAYGNSSDVIVISNHINAGGGEGAEVIYALRNNDTLARNILESLGEAGQTMRSYYQRRLPGDTSKDYYFILRNTGNTQPVIVEYGFIDNSTDLARIQNNYRQYANAVVDAVINTFGGITGTGNTYVVKSGDSLWSIASRYNTTVNTLKSLNNLTTNSLTIGQVLRLPTSTTTPSTGNTYVVKSGDSLWSIASRYNTTVNTLKSLNNLTTNSLTIGQVLRLPSSTTSTGNTYVVKSGDSLWSIASRYNTTVNTLKSLNNLTSNTLSIGQVLTVPSSTTSTGNTYVVKSGDSLWSIANRYNTTVNTLKSLNNLTSNTLSIGQVLNVPSTTTSTGNTYVVKSGDSLWTIANRYNTTVNTLKSLNNLTSNTLSIGQVLKLPS